MRAAGLKERRVVRAFAGSILAVATACGAVVGLSSTVASGATPETATVAITTITSTVAFGFEAQTIKGTITGQTGDGFPTSGAITVVTSTTVTLCTGSLTHSAGDAADETNFTCDAATETKLPASGTAYEVHAKYAGGSSSNTTFTYGAATSTTHGLTVVTPTTETPTVSFTNFVSPVAHGAEAQIFTGRVTGVAGDGYPSSGAVTVLTSTTVTLCTGGLTGGSGDVATFTCDQTTNTKLAVSGTSYVVHAHYAGGASNLVNFKYRATSSATRTLKVVTGTATTTTLALNHTTRALGSETSEVVSVTVTGKTGDGEPEGKVTVKTTTGKTVCATTTRSTGSTDSSKFTCSPSASKLSVGSYKLTATFAPTAARSSTDTSVVYKASSSSAVSFKVVSGVTTTSVLSLNAISRRSGAETAEVFTVTVTGKSGDGYPKGTVKVKTSGGTALCTKTTATTHSTDSATFACSPHASALTSGTYTIEATYTPSTPSSSTASITYVGSTSNSESFTVGSPTATRIYGPTPDGTAAQELESVYPGSKGNCPGSTSNRPVVLATDGHFPDALAASYLAKWLGTGMLLTPVSSIKSVTLTALRVEGITHVYVVGGPLAVSTSDVSQLESTDAYECGGSTRTGSHITVTRIFGQTQYTTAEDIAETPGSSFVGSVNLQGAYGLYNDTSGRSSSAPGAGSMRTAILASGAEFQDAEASATLAYADDLPLVLTAPTALSAPALSALTTLGITQVVLMGGPLAVTNTVVTDLVSHHISVLRVAGTNYTDTAAQLADMELGTTSGHKGLAWSPTGGVTVAQGSFYTDGLAGAVVSAHGGTTAKGPQPMLLTQSPTVVGNHLTTFLDGAGSKGIDSDGTAVTSLTVLGGPLAVTTTVVTDMEDDL